MPGVVLKSTPLADEPRLVPLVAAFHQRMVLPADVAFKFTLLPWHTVPGVAVTDVGAAGVGLTVTAAVAALAGLLM